MVDAGHSIRSDAATIRVQSGKSGDAPPVAHRETLLCDLPPRGSHPYVLICDDREQVIGVVPSSEIDKRLLSSNLFERTRWGAMPIGAMSKLTFANTNHTGPRFDSEEVTCAAIRQGDTLFGLSVDGDLFFSWKRLESLFSEALSDPLTGLMNRLAYERRLKEEWSRSVRSKVSIGVVVVDLDDFKTVNDTYGHVVGDQVLLSVAQQLESSMRSYDVVARFGGDEFVALCLGCDQGEIDIPVTRIMKSLQDISIPVGDKRLKISASIGAAVRHSGFDCYAEDELFVAADNCLYKAKDSNQRAWKCELHDGMSDLKPVESMTTQGQPGTTKTNNQTADVQ